MSDSPWDRAVAAFQDGDLVAAEQILRDAVAATAEAGGPAFADASFRLASMLGAMGEHLRGAEALRAAAGAELPGDDGERDRLTYLMNLGEFLTRAGQHGEASTALLASIEGRAAFYGEAHPGYAFGVEPLADLRLREGDADTALALFDQCLHIFWEAGHPRVTSALAGRAYALAALGGSGLLDPAEQLPDELMPDTISALVQRCEGLPRPAAQILLDATLSLAEVRCPDEIRRIISAQASVAGDLGDHVTRIDALTALEPLARSEGEHIDILLALGMSHDEAGDYGPAEQRYAQAVALAEELDDPAFLSRTQRNAGLYLAERGRREEARRLLAGAVAVARDADLLPELGRGLVALGIFDQHGGDLAAAEATLSEAITLLPPDDQDRLCGVSHLDAIREDGRCGCGRIDQAFSDALRALIEPHLPEGLLERLTVTLGDDEPQVAVELSRGVSKDEAETLNALIQSGLAQLDRG